MELFPKAMQRYIFSEYKKNLFKKIDKNYWHFESSYQNSIIII